MNTQDLINIIRDNPNLSLRFNINRSIIPKNYHVSEVKQALYKSMDCAGKAHEWKENILHIYHPTQEKHFRSEMTTDKLLSIFNRVEGAMSMDSVADVKVEYSADREEAMSSYNISRIEKMDHCLMIFLGVLSTECKPLVDKKVVGNHKKSCCSL